MGQKLSPTGRGWRWGSTLFQFHLVAVEISWVFFHFHTKLSILMGERIVQIKWIRRKKKKSEMDIILSQTLKLGWLPGKISPRKGPLLSLPQPDVSNCTDHEKKGPCLPKQRIYLASIGLWINPLVAQTQNPSLVVQSLRLSSARHKNTIKTKPGDMRLFFASERLPCLSLLIIIYILHLFSG